MDYVEYDPQVICYGEGLLLARSHSLEAMLCVPPILKINGLVWETIWNPMWSIFHGTIHGFQFWFSLPIDWSDSRSDHWMRNVDLAESNLSLGWCWIWTRSSSFPLRNRALFWLRPNWLKRLKTSKKHEFPCRRLPRWIRKYLFSSALESAWNVHGLA